MDNRDDTATPGPVDSANAAFTGTDRTKPEEFTITDFEPPSQSEANATELAGYGKPGAQESTPLGRYAGMVAGAAEGVSEGLEQHNLADGARRAVQEGARFVEALRPKLNTTAMQERLIHGIDEAKANIKAVADETKERAHAVAQAAERATKAPRLVARDLKEAAGAYTSGFARGLGLYAAAGVVGVAALTVLTVGFVVGLDRLLGAPWGEFIVAIAYAIGAFIVVGLAKAAHTRGRVRAMGHMQAAQEELRHVTRPVRRAFSRHAIRHGDYSREPIAKPMVRRPRS